MKFDNIIFLKDHILKILSFYNKNSFDKNGGFFNVFFNDGSIFDKKNRHLVSGSRFVFNYAKRKQRHFWKITYSALTEQCRMQVYK